MDTSYFFMLDFFLMKKCNMFFLSYIAEATMLQDQMHINV